MIAITPKQAAVFLGTVVVFLAAANAAGAVSKYVFDHDQVWGLVDLFDLGGEENVPTLFSTVLLLLCSTLLSLIAVVTCEETLEMIGLVIFIYALMVYIETVQNGMTLQVGVGAAGATPSRHPFQPPGQGAPR